MQFDTREVGIPSVGELPWGSHFCQFYETRQDLLDVLVPYFRAGLANNELCSWTVSGPLSVAAAQRALKKAEPRFAEFLGKGQLEIRPERLRPTRGSQAGRAVVAKLDEAVAKGFDGLRLAAPAIRAGRGGRDFVCPGAEAMARLNVIAVHCYPRDQFDAVGLMAVVRKHRFALVRNAGRWEILESAEALTVEEALKRSEEKLHSLFDNMSEGFAYHRIVLDASGRPCDYVFLEINEAFARQTGLEAEQIIGKRVTTVLPGIEQDPTDWIGKYGEVALTGKPTQFESYSAALDRWYSISAFCPHRGFFAVTFSDITARKRAEAERRAVEDRLAVTLRSIGDAVLSTDPEGRITFLNPVAAALTGFTDAEAAGRPAREVFRIIDEISGAPGEDIVRRVLREKRVVALANHTSLVARDGRAVPIEDSAAPILTDDGELTGVVLVFHDVTEKRRAVEALRRAHDELEDRVAKRTAQLRHANEQLEARAVQLRALASELTHIEQRERRRIATLLHDNLQQLLVAAKLRASTLERTADTTAQAAGVAIVTLLDEAIKSSRSLTAEISPPILYDQGLVPALRWLTGWMSERHGLAVELSVEDAAGRLPEDVSVLLFESVREILFNVVKHAGVSAARVAVGVEDHRLRITVSDQGLGFAASPPRSAGSTGGGFGLLSIRERLGLVGGALQVTSAPGVGSRVVLVAPATRDAAPAPRPEVALVISTSPAPAARLDGPIRVLLADDHPVMRDGLAAMLALEPDIEVIGEAADGLAAIERAAQLTPDVVLMDVSMAGMGGIDATRTIRERWPQVKVVGLSMSEDSDVARAMLAAGASAYLSKSGPTQEIVRAVRACATQESSLV